MAFLTLHTVSAQLKMTTVINVILPDSVRMDVPMSERKVLYLLHGLSDDGTMWLRRSTIETEAERYGLVVVMPSVDRSFYCDGVHGQNYFTYITSELPEYMHKVFHLSLKKEDNLIAGLSMGGYGAMRAALTFPERYRTVGSFSGVLALEPLAYQADPALAKEFPFLAAAFTELNTTTLNPINLLENARDIQLYVSCGLQDELLICSKQFEARASALGVPGRFHYSAGGHDWTFWNQQISDFLRFALEGN
ncbi:MAG: alpha/beta hydrolase family protein [Candidatus Omnitrophota bacterium]|nr:alpha/beta hydrolase family protein [Candidatus Omnitrophota bacterium]